MPVPLELKDKIKRISNLPTLPQVATHLLACINDPTTSSKDVAGILAQDMSISAKVLRLSNSAFYGMPRKITNINEAVVVLGFKVINTMVLSLTVFDMFPDAKDQPTFNRAQFWQHSVFCALLAKLIADVVDNRDVSPDESFCCGLLHDVGKIVMEQYLHDDLQKVVKQVNSQGRSSYEIENEILGYTHTDVAEWLVNRWNLPDVLFYPIIHHHTPLKIKSFTSNNAVCHLADYFCYELELTQVDADQPSPPLIQECYGALEFNNSHLDQIKERLPEEMERVASFLDVLRG